jgi:predicted regulator of Ras-like GTPase activity (Roadblock/LC7/MglB family)
LLGRALAGNPADDGLAIDLRRVHAELRGTNGHENGSRAVGSPIPEPNDPRQRVRVPTAADEARSLFAPLLGDGDRTALLLDRDGLVLAGTYVDGAGNEVADEVGAYLAGLADESGRALEQLGLGRWELLLVEAQHATVALGPSVDGGVVMVAAARDTQVGLVRRLLSLASRRAAAWLGAAA